MSKKGMLRMIPKYLNWKIKMEEKTRKIRCELDIDTYKKVGHFCIEHDLYMTDLIKIALLEYIDNHSK